MARAVDPRITEAEREFWELAEEFLGRNGVVEGTLMGQPCLRVGGEFLAMFYAKEGGMIVRLTEARVGEVIAEGIGEPFAPARHVFREWVAIPHPRRSRWRAILREGVEINGGSGRGRGRKG